MLNLSLKFVHNAANVGKQIKILLAQPILDRLSGEIMTSLKKPEVVAKIDQLGFTVEPRDPATFRPYWENEVATWVKIAKDAGVQPEE